MINEGETAVRKDISEVINLMKENNNKNGLFTSYAMRIFWLIGYIFILVMLSGILYFISPTMNESNIISIVSLYIAVMAFGASITDFILKGIEKKNTFVIYRYSRSCRIEEFVIKLRIEANKEKMDIRDIEVFTVKNKVYLKIYY